ncbi:MAG: cytidine deaminase [Bacteroides sp.]|nr:cytidine deaminase [Roseburia sp.]MCM1347071.1 cytidine deaminase [Bacteroides sp.]MCM1420546.1 cytidine deaminase [Bacteroides sp.]
MKDFDITVHVVVKDVSELNGQELRLVESAKEAAFRSYSPYSKFCVGAAVLLDNGEIVTGSNQENCAYPSGICAERTAVFYANSQYPDNGVVAICIAARDASGEFTAVPITPCGSCRQVLIETENRGGRNIEIMLYGTDAVYFVESAKALLPVSFDDSFLK